MSNVRIMTIGEKIRAVRLEKGFSQRKLQEKSGVERNFLSLVENNHRSPSFKTLMRIAQALGVSVGYITDYGESPVQADGPHSVPELSLVKTLHQILQENERPGADRLGFFPTPVVSETSLAAGKESFCESDVEDYVFISSKLIVPPSKTGRYRCLWVKEEQKALPPLVEVGSLICIDCSQRDPWQLDDEVVVFQDKHGGCVVRRLRFHSDHILGLPEKPIQQHPLVIPVSEQGAVLGKVIWCWNQFNSQGEPEKKI